MNKFLLVFTCVLSTYFSLGQISIGDCDTGGVVAKGLFKNYEDADNNYVQGEYKLEKTISNQVLKTYHLVNSGATGSIGFDISHSWKMDSTGNLPCTTIKNSNAALYAVGDCSGKMISPTIGPNNSPLYNPEFKDLSPNTDYILLITSNVLKECEVDKIWVTYYSASKSTCSASVGTVSVVGASSSASNQYDLMIGSEITIESKDFVLPTSFNGNNSSFGYFIFDQEPLLPFKNVNPDSISKIPGFMGISKGASLKDANNNGKSTSLTNSSLLWFVPAVFDKSEGGFSIDEDKDGCFQIGDPIRVNYLQTTSEIACGKCEVAKCPIVSVLCRSSLEGSQNLSNSNDYNNNSNFQVAINNGQSPVVFSNFYEIDLKEKTLLFGVKQKVIFPPSTVDISSLKRNAILRQKCDTDSIPMTRSNGNKLSSGFNPEWENLEKGIYVIEIITSVPKDLILNSNIAGFYYAPDSLVTNPLDTTKATTVLKNEIKKLEFFPNPVKDILQFNNQISSDVNITDCFGKRIFVTKVNPFSIDCSNLQNGIYFIKEDYTTYQFVVSH